MSTGATTPALRIAHHHPGRLRLRADAFLDGAPLAERARLGLGEMPGVRFVAHDPRTGSFLLEYEPHCVDVNGLIERIAEVAGLEVVSARPSKSKAALRIIRVVRKLDAITEALSSGRLDLGVLIPGSLAALGAYSFFKGPHMRMPRWDSLLYWSYSIFIHAHASAGRPSQ